MSDGGVLAHQGGWDEVLLVLSPILVLSVLLWVANRRAVARRDDHHGEEASDGRRDRDVPPDRPR